MRLLIAVFGLLLLLHSSPVIKGQLSLFQPEDDNLTNPEWHAPDPDDLGSSIIHDAVDLSAVSEQADGGEQSKSLEDMLHWAISHADPVKLRQEAERVQTENAVNDLLEARKKVKELHEYLKNQPSEAELMKEAIEIIKGESDLIKGEDISLEESQELQLIALQRLQELVEPIDNANDLQKLDGITPVVALISSHNQRLVAGACYVLGTASSNNPTFQAHLFEIEPQIFEILLSIVDQNKGDVAGKCLYAVSNLVRNTASIRAAFLQAGGLKVVTSVLHKPRAEPRLKRKALDLFADLVQLEPGEVSKFMNAASGPALVQALLSLVLQDDLDTQEKTLIVLRVLSGSHQNRQVLYSYGALSVLETLSSRLSNQAKQNSEDQYFEYVAGLCDSVLTTLRAEQRLEL